MSATNVNKKAGDKTSDSKDNETKATTEKKDESSSPADGEMDAGSELFNPLRVLYAKDVRISKKNPPVGYQNIAAFESALKRLGVWGVQQKPNKSGAVEPSGSKSMKTVVKEEKQLRRFLPHQMPIKAVAGSSGKQRYFKNIWNSMDKVQGPLRMLTDSVKMQRKVYVLVRNEYGVRGHMEGNVISFDKHWNLLLSNVKEVWRRRKFMYGTNKTCEAGNRTEDCTQRLIDLGITMPEQNVKSLDRKNVEITRFVEQLVIRGEQIVLVSILPTTAKTK